MGSPTPAGEGENLPAPESVYSLYREFMDLGGAHLNAQETSFPKADSISPEAGLGGQLVIYSLLDLSGSATALAASIAGAASLGIDPDTDRLKLAIRNGVCDFVVNSLDEAVRIFKNEIRKKNAVAVGLSANVASCIAEIVERGLQPHMLAFAPRSSAGAELVDASLDTLQRRGARALENTPPPLMHENMRWSVEKSPARWLPRLTALAANVVASQSPATDDRLRWLRLSPRYFPGASYHFSPMSALESEKFVAAVREQTASGRIAVPVTLEFHDPLHPSRVEVIQPGT